MHTDPATGSRAPAVPADQLAAPTGRQVMWLEYSLIGASDQAESELRRACERYIADLISRVQADEDNDRAKALSTPEITASTVIRADARLRERTPRVKPTRTLLAAQFLSPAAGSVAGIYGGIIASSNASVADGVMFGCAFVTSILATGWVVWGPR